MADPTWTSDSDWNAGSKTNVDVASGSFQLAGLDVLEDFEDGSASDWVNSAGAAIQAISGGYEGSYKGTVHYTSGNNAANYKSITAVSPSHVFVAIRLRSAESIAAERGVWDFLNGSTRIFNVAMDTRNGFISVSYQGYSNVTDTGVSITQNQWFFVEFKDIDWGANVIGSVEIDSTEVLTNEPFLNNGSEIDKIQQRCAGTNDAYSDSDYWGYIS